MGFVGRGKDAPHICRHTAATWLVDIYEATCYLGMTPRRCGRLTSTIMPTISDQRHPPLAKANLERPFGSLEGRGLGPC